MNKKKLKTNETFLHIHNYISMLLMDTMWVERVYLGMSPIHFNLSRTKFPMRISFTHKENNTVNESLLYDIDYIVYFIYVQEIIQSSMNHRR